MIRITPAVVIDENDIQFDFVRSSGPGGQNVNKVASSVVLRYDTSKAILPPNIRERLGQLAGSRLTDDGILILKGQQFRTQERNREDVIKRLTDLMKQACEIPKRRVATKPTRASKIRTLESKRHRASVKQARRLKRQPDE